MLRLQKVLAQHGLASRRAAEELILEGRVTVNGQVAVLGTKVGVGDKVVVDGQPLCQRESLTYLMLNKPRGYVTTVEDPHAQKTVMDLMTDIKVRVFPVGRLDKDTEGLLLFTNDGDLTHRLLHPSRHVAKTYFVEVQGHLSSAAMGALEAGVMLDDGLTAAARVAELTHKAARSTFLLTIFEGRKRQIRRMCSVVGHEVVYLQRLAIGPLTLGDLAIGAYRHLSSDEVAQLVIATEEAHHA
ncbi:MAG: rRNA pseudouridine synthase [Firmicutes bacterium]|nr:rRNA pseudouridine synthase [Dethiobacter sp.]MBS3889353.1 rRNA pseudouridine synthase [Bacillota bacterium]MBS4055317.1 rRNA pseudouridine synthase [Thermaerobacter sp.]